MFCTLGYYDNEYPCVIDSLTIDGGTLYINTTFSDYAEAGYILLTMVSYHMICIEVKKSDVTDVTDIKMTNRVVLPESPDDRNGK